MILLKGVVVGLNFVLIDFDFRWIGECWFDLFKVLKVGIIVIVKVLRL